MMCFCLYYLLIIIVSVDLLVLPDRLPKPFTAVDVDDARKSKKVSG